MNGGRLRTAALAAVTSLLVPATALANAPEDLQGVSARTNAMGGAGTALTGDFSAAYYNPAGLAFCNDDQVGVDIRHTVYSLRLRRTGTEAPAAAPKELRDQTRVTAGACLRLPYGISAGLSFGVGLQNPMTLDQNTVNPQPQFVMYGESLEQLSVALGIAYRPVRQFAFGFGGSILVNSALGFSANVPIGVGEDMRVNVRWDLIPTGAPYVGVIVEPLEGLKFGVTYRGPLYHNLDTPATIRAEALGIALDIPLQIYSVGWYSPRQLAVGMSYSPVEELTITADVTWYAWHYLNKTYYPFLNVTAQEGTDDTIAGALDYAVLQPPGWRDIWQPRIGGELALLDGHLMIRGGYSFRPGAIDPHATTNVNLLDGAMHSISLGAGYYFGRRTDQREENIDPGVQRDLDRARAERLAAADAAAATSTDATAVDGATPADDTTAVEGEAVAEADLVEEEAPSNLPSITAQVDAFFRANMMPTVYVPERDYSFGGNVFDFGLMMTLGWY